MKFYLLLITVLVISFTSACGVAPGAGEASDQVTDQADGPSIRVEEPFARASMPNGAIYLKLVNDGAAPEVLLRAETEVAEATELHETKMDDNDVMRMSPVEQIELPAGGSVALEPGGKHVMLMGLREGLAAGDTIELTLVFEQAGPLTLQVEVREGMGHEPR